MSESVEMNGLLLILLLIREQAAGQSPGPYGTLPIGTGGYKTDRQNRQGQ